MNETIPVSPVDPNEKPQFEITRTGEENLADIKSSEDSLRLAGEKMGEDASQVPQGLEQVDNTFASKGPGPLVENEEAAAVKRALQSEHVPDTALNYSDEKIEGLEIPHAVAEEAGITGGANIMENVPGELRSPSEILGDAGFRSYYKNFSEADLKQVPFNGLLKMYRNYLKVNEAKKGVQGTYKKEPEALDQDLAA